ncbi:ester cyclase [Amycolatopsis sp. H6(2020)]|nr:ester cyclase [Amycolatopsis sp. H6(2020)]
MGIAENKKVVARFEELITTQELDLLDELCTPDMINHALAPGPPAGLAGTREFLSTSGRTQFMTTVWPERFVVAEGDLVVWFGVRGGRWAGGNLFGFDAPEGDYERGFTVMYRLEDGKIAERWAVRDDLGMLRQLGAVPGA